MIHGNIDSYDYYYFFEYLPKRHDANEEQQLHRRLVYDFKDGRFTALYDRILSGITERLEGNRIDWVLCCIPASTSYKTSVRFNTLMIRLCQSIGLINGYSAITVREDHEAQHLTEHKNDIVGKLNFNPDIIRGKKIILIDDVITRGKSFNQVARKLKSLGANSVIGFFIAKTVNPKVILSQGYSTDSFTVIQPSFPPPNRNDENIATIADVNILEAGIFKPYNVVSVKEFIKVRSRNGVFYYHVDDNNNRYIWSMDSLFIAAKEGKIILLNKSGKKASVDENVEKILYPDNIGRDNTGAMLI